MEFLSAFDQLIQHGIFNLQQGDFDKAVHSFSQALQQSSDSVCAYANRATAHYAQGNYEGALNDLSRALELAPDLFALYMNRGMTYRKIGESERAASDFGQAIRLSPQQFCECLDRLVILPSEQAALPHRLSPQSSTNSTQNSSALSPPVNYNLIGIARPEFNKNIYLQAI